MGRSLKTNKPILSRDMFITKSKTGMYNIRNNTGKFTKSIKIFNREGFKGNGKVNR